MFSGKERVMTLMKPRRIKHASGYSPRLLTLLFVVLLAVIASAPVATPSQALDETCRTWSAESLEDEGGPVLTVGVCSDSDTWLFLTCYEGTVWIRYDLAAGSATAPELDSTALVTFTSGPSDVTLEMAYQEMDG